jgi:membrane protein implicated in regulation of membrane protease activity
MARVVRATKNPSPRLVWIVLSSVAVGTLGILAGVWVLANPLKDTLWYEVAKTCLQVISVAVIGGIVTIATYKLQHDRQRADQELERRREEFDRRATLLNRASRCAQKMFVTCQHVRRVQADHQDDQIIVKEAQTLLDQAYLDFSAEAEALEMELGAWYGIRKTIQVEDVSGEAYLRWHQVRDLLTVYYFDLCGNFRRDVLKTNSRSDRELHSGLEFQSMVTDPLRPTEDELRKIRNQIRPIFNETLPVLANAILRDELRP